MCILSSVCVRSCVCVCVRPSVRSRIAIPTGHIKQDVNCIRVVISNNWKCTYKNGVFVTTVDNGVIVIVCIVRGNG